VIARVKAALRPLRVYRAARFGWNFLRDPIFRHDHWLAWRQPENLFQFRSITAPDRYPYLFGYLRDAIATPQPHLLSFGCATGEEVFSLRRYFPSAAIKGLDINPANIAACRARLQATPDPTIAFEQNSSADAEPPSSYAAVLALAVFQHPALKHDRSVAICASRLRFADYERIVTGLAACVQPGGYLVIRHSMFRFADTVCSKDFSVRLEQPVEATFFPRFDRENRRLPDASTEQVVFQKLLL